MLNILIAEDEPALRRASQTALEQAGHRVTTASNGCEAEALIKHQRFDLVLSDVRMPKLSGTELLVRMNKLAPECRMILMTAFQDTPTAVSAMKGGALDYLMKPVNIDELLELVGDIDRIKAIEVEIASSVERSKLVGERTRIITEAPQMAVALEAVDAMAATDAPVLINGESGTGKELIAQRIHEGSHRSRGPFVAVNCGSFPDTLIESELFGYARGAFTGAVRSRDGRFVAANGGTLFLDEIAELPLMAQAKLLRVLEEGCVDPLGTNESVPIDVRIISATHQNLRDRIQQGLFREDLYYRLKVLDITLPPLRERSGDIPLLAAYFAAKYSSDRTEAPKISPEAWGMLMSHAFPGNVRELEHIVHRAIVLSGGGPIEPRHLPEEVSSGRVVAAQSDGCKPLFEAIKAFEREYIQRVLEDVSGKRTAAAERLGISRKNLWEKIRLHHLETPVSSKVSYQGHASERK